MFAVLDLVLVVHFFVSLDLNILDKKEDLWTKKKDLVHFCVSFGLE